MNINSIISQLNNSFSLKGSEVQNSELISNLQNGLNELLGKEVNSLIQGKIISLEGSNILLSIGDNQLINASLEGNINTKVGQMMTFSVNTLSDGKITLSPLFENTAQSSTVSNALEQAGLPNDARMQYMVKSMMDQGMPINRESLYSMNRISMKYDNEDISNLVRMTKLDIPITTENIEMFRNYSNYEHQITKAMDNISESIMDSVNEITITGENHDAIEFLDSVLNKLGIFEEEESGENENNPSVNESIKTTENNINFNDMNRNVIVKDNENNLVRESFAESLKTVGVDDESIKSILKNNTFSAKEIANVIKLVKHPFQPDVEKDIKDILGNDIFKNSLKKSITEKFLLDPSDISKDGNVSKLYEKMNNSLHSLLEELSSQGKQNTTLYQNVNNLTSNLDFINQLNQTFTYVQIPVKLDNQNANGDLYVYTNKKSLASKDGDISALLHLDMDNLGTVDVHVTLKESNNVKTKFYLKDDSVIDLFAANIDTLNKRLESRGYSMSSEFIQKESTNAVIDTIVKSHGNIQGIVSESFDARA